MSLNPLPQATKDRWLPLLEGGKLKQAKGKLATSTDPDTAGYCCLGVYALACGASVNVVVFEDEDEDGNTYEQERDELAIEVPGYGDVNASELLDQQWADQHGLTNAHQTLLSSLNDGGEHVIPNHDPLIEVWRKHFTDVSMKNGTVIAGHTKFYSPSRDFAYIAKVIREDL